MFIPLVGDGDVIVSAGGDGKLKVWSPSGHCLSVSLPRPAASRCSPVLSALGRSCAACHAARSRCCLAASGPPVSLAHVISSRACVPAGTADRGAVVVRRMSRTSAAVANVLSTASD